MREELKQKESFGHCERNTSERRCSPSEEIERKTVRVLSEWKRKKETFFFAQVTYKEDKLVEVL